MRSVKALLICTALCCIIAVSMIIGINIAWNNSPLSSAPEQSANSLVTNNLEVSVEQINLDGTLTAIEKDNLLFGEDTVWTPGHAEIVYLVVTNKEETVVNYSIGVNFADSAAAKNAAGEEVKLSDVLHFGIVDSLNDFYGEPADAIADLGVSKALSSGFSRVGAIDAEGIEILAVLVYLPESAGELTGGEISLGLSLYVTSPLVEEEIAPVIPNYFTGSVNAPAVDTNGATTESVTIGEDSKISAVLPEGVKLENGATELSLSVNGVAESEANITANHRSEVVNAVDVHIDGIAEDNTVPMAIVLNGFLPKGLNSNNVKLYHVEDGVTNEMVLVDNPKNHNEFAYDPATGDVVITIASFSEIVLYGDTTGAWDGETFDYTWYNADATELAIANASQFAAFRNIVDGGYYDKNWNWVEVAQDSFEGQKITLSADINLNSHLFDPIGWGYDNTAWNRNGAVGKVFKGHFDGDNHTIYGLYQNGWDLDPDKTNYSNYTYTNCGFGLFASALDATFENLNINGADIRVECVETGVIVGLAQGSCTFRNINILGCRAANYQRPVGGVVGEVSPKMVNGVAQEGDASKHTFDNVYVDSNTVVGSMWGDFDAPVGGVIGAYWDDAGKTTVEMKNVTVACRLDVYNDVTSTYQWYAYRRAGMLIGNTDQSEKNENGTNIASTKINGVDFLTCSDVTVCYGEWANYHYCEFNKANPHWPWVRVEPGEYCEGYSNPRWGRPIDPNTGNPVTDSVHDHGEGEGHMQLIEFHQLYGGGQGVYGAKTHSGVTEGQLYTVTYMDRDEILHVDYVPSNLPYTEDDVWAIENAKAANGDVPSYWVDANNEKFTGFGAGRTANAIVYPKWPDEYVIRCLDDKGNVAYYNFAIVGSNNDTTEDQYVQFAEEINSALVTIQNEVDKDKKVMVMVWKVVDNDNDDTNDTIYETITADIIKSVIKPSNGEGKDFIIEAVPQLQETSITLKKYYDPVTGELVAYHVTEVAQGDDNTSVVIPDYVGNIPVTIIEDGAAEGFDKLHAVTIPSTVENIGNNAFAGKPTFNFLGNPKGETQTFYYEGDPTKFNEQLQKHLDNGESEMFSRLWDSGLGKGTRIFFLKEGKIDPDAGYWELTELQIESRNDGNFFNPNYVILSEEYVWTYYPSVRDKATDFTNEYTGSCDCGCGTRPDEDYWIGVFDTAQ